jgi:putative ABC transport system permease protein
MIWNYLAVALRGMARHKSSTAINLLGLSVGITACLLMTLFVLDELSYDRFHRDTQNLYRITNQTSSGREWACMQGPVAYDMFETVPDVSYARIWPQYDQVVAAGNERRLTSDVYFTDPGFFDVFTFPVLQGDATSALAGTHRAVLTRSMAKRLFGDRNPIGETVQYNERYEWTITGIIDDVPRNSHLKFDILATFESADRFTKIRTGRSGNNVYQYVRFSNAYTPSQFTVQAAAYVAEAYKGSQRRFLLQPVSDIHLYSHLEKELSPNSSIDYVFIFGGSALFILLIACINFVNLTTAQSSRRAREIGLRKVVGAHRHRLILQFLSESVFLAFVATVLSIALSDLLLPLLNELAGKTLSLGVIGNGATILILLSLVALVGATAGMYPALYLSSFEPVQVLSGSGSHASGRSRLRSTLVVTQLAISITLMIVTIVVFAQLEYMQTRNMGFQGEQVVVLQTNDSIRPTSLRTLKSGFQTSPDVLSVSSVSGLPGYRIGWGKARLMEDSEVPLGDDIHSVRNFMCDSDAVEALGLEIVEGRAFSVEEDESAQFAFILNETAAKRFGWENPVGSLIKSNGRWVGRVVGIVKDFSYASLHEKIDPLCLVYHHKWRGYNRAGSGFLAVRMTGNDVNATVSHLRSVWDQVYPGHDLTYSFLDEKFARLHQYEQRMGDVMAVFSCVSIFVACLGLLGLASHAAIQRSQEIGVRKALGATSQGIVTMLAREYAMLILISNCLAWPVAYFGMVKWLESFAFRAELSAEAFLLSGLLAGLLAVSTVAYHGIRQSLANPVDVLRYE